MKKPNHPKQKYPHPGQPRTRNDTQPRGSNISNPHGYQSNGFKKNRDVTPV